MQATKTVRQGYSPDEDMLKFLDDFRKMTNEAIRIALQENVTSQFSITRKVFSKLSGYPYPTAYRNAAINMATGILRNYRKDKRKHPDMKKPFVARSLLRIWIKKEGVAQIIGNKLRLSLQTKKQYAFIPLSDFVLRSIEGYTVRSVCLTACTLSLAFSKEVAEIVPTGLIGIDRNLDNVTTSDLNGNTKVYDLSEATRVKAVYRQVRSHFTRNDYRISKKVHGKYGRRQRNIVKQILHTASKAIVTKAQATNSSIVMEDLTGIRKLYHKGNGQGTKYRGRMNGWSFYELQRQIEYKANWFGIPVIYVKPNKTSAICSICGCEVTKCVGRKVWCSHCMKSMDRDENAAFNIAKRGSFLAPDGLVIEAMKGNEKEIESLANCLYSSKSIQVKTNMFTRSTRTGEEEKVGEVKA